jgi:UDP-glucose 4-epimerase
MVKAEDLGNFYRIPIDSGTLNYDAFFVKGNEKIYSVEEYTSANTVRLTVNEIIKKLLDLDYIQTELKTKEYVGVSK